MKVNVSPKVDQFDTSDGQLVHFIMNTDLHKIYKVNKHW